MSAHDDLDTNRRKLLDANMEDNIISFTIHHLWALELFKLITLRLFYALKTYYRHLNWVEEENNSNLSMTNTALEKAFCSVH
jgi:hypothetical protein